MYPILERIYFLKDADSNKVVLLSLNLRFLNYYNGRFL